MLDDFLFKPLFKFETCVNDLCYIEPASASTTPIALIIFGLCIGGLFGCFSLFNKISARNEKNRERKRERKQ